jgi:hypothetical protein
MKLARWIRWTVLVLIVIAMVNTGACGKAENEPPVITSVTATPANVGLGDTTTLACVASDTDEDTITYSWTVTGGTISGEGSTVTWIAPSVEGDFTISVTVDDGEGGTDTGTVEVSVVVTAGSISVESNPSGAAIYLDGSDTGNISPHVIIGVEAGAHTVRLTYSHYKDRQEQVRVSAGETTYINWVLTRAPAQTITIQPAPDVSMDAHVEEVIPDGNLGLSETIWIGEWPGGQRNRSYLQFDLSSIPTTAVVLKAELRLYYHSSSSVQPVDVGAYEVTSSWNDSTITWNVQPTSASTPEYVRTVPANVTDYFESWYIEDLAQGWIDGSITNYGVVLRDTDETTTKACKGFYASDLVYGPRRPALVIEYYDAIDP